MYWVFIEHHALAILFQNTMRNPPIRTIACTVSANMLLFQMFQKLPWCIHLTATQLTGQHTCGFGPRRKGQRSPESVSSEAWMYASFFTRRCQMLGNADSQAVRSACMAFLPVSIVFLRHLMRPADHGQAMCVHSATTLALLRRPLSDAATIGSMNAVVKLPTPASGLR